MYSLYISQKLYRRPQRVLGRALPRRGPVQAPVPGVPIRVLLDHGPSVGGTESVHGLWRKLRQTRECNARTSWPSWVEEFGQSVVCTALACQCHCHTGGPYVRPDCCLLLGAKVYLYCIKFFIIILEYQIKSIYKTFLHTWVLICETDLINLINLWFVTIMTVIIY